MPNAWTWSEVAIQSAKVDYFTGNAPVWLRSQEVLPKATSGIAFWNGPSITNAVDPLLSPPALVGSNGRMRVIARDSKVSVRPLSTVEFSPVGQPLEGIDRVAMVVEGRTVRTELLGSGKILPVFRTETSRLPGERKDVRLYGIEGNGRQRELLRCDLRTVASTGNPKAELTQTPSVATLNVLGVTNKEVDLFMGESYLGSLKNLSKCQLDLRQLPAGTFEMWSIVQDADGIVHEPSRHLVEIPIRYRVESDFDQAVFSVEGVKSNLEIRAVGNVGAGIAKTRLFLQGVKVAESTGVSLTNLLSLLDVPSGLAEIQVVGVGEDGVQFAPQTHRIKVKNPYFDALLNRDVRARSIVELTKRIEKCDEDVAYWYERAKSEPDFRTYSIGKSIFASDGMGRFISVGYLDTFSIPGDPGKYLAECRAAVVRRAGIRLELGKTQKLLGWSDKAKSTLEQVVEDAGAKSGIGQLAQQELVGL
jgi:hypothetical protein